MVWDQGSTQTVQILNGCQHIKLAFTLATLVLVYWVWEDEISFDQVSLLVLSSLRSIKV